MIRRFLITLAALAYLVSATTAQAGYLINPFWVATSPPSITFLQCTSSISDLTTYTFAAQNVGTASDDRYTGVGVFGQDATTIFGVSTVTVGGGSATEIVDEDGTGLVDTAFYMFLNTAGTSEDIVVTFSEAVTGAGVCLFQINNIASGTAVASVPDDDTAAGPVILTHNVSALGVSVGVCTTQGIGNRTSWTGQTERTDAEDAEISWSAADFTNDDVADTPLTVNCDYLGTKDTSGVAASFL